MARLCNGVFEGGGVKGIGLAGAAAMILHSGYEFAHVAGTSAGAIVASLLAAGYDGTQIWQIMRGIDYRKFRQEDALDRIGAFGKALSIAFEYGIYNADYFESWLSALLAKKNCATFGDLRTGSQDPNLTYRFQAVASDLSDRSMLVLPGSLTQFGIDPDSFPIAKAVRMSMSIPVFFEPYRLHDAYGKEHIIVDGGVLSNYPIWLLDDGHSVPAIPTFGFKLTSGQNSAAHPISNIIDYAKSLAGTLLDAHDNYHISTSKGDYARSILIGTTIDVMGVKKSIGAVDFDITPLESDALFSNGQTAADTFLSTWDFDSWKQKYRAY